MKINSTNRCLKKQCRVRKMCLVSFFSLLMITKAEEDNYWEDQKIRNNMEEPPKFRNVLKAVFHLKGSIGYVYRKDYKEGVVKILTVIPAK